MMRIAAVVDWNGIVVGAMPAKPGNGSDPENERVLALGCEQLGFKPSFLGAAEHRFRLVVGSGDGNARGAEVGKDETHATDGKSMVNRDVARARHERIVRNVFLISEPGRFVHAGFSVAVVPPEIVVVPHVNKRNIAIEGGLRARGEDEIVTAAKRVAIVLSDIEVM